MVAATDNAQDLASSLARTSDKYNQLPYQALPTTLSHPARIAAIARLFGLDPPAVERARVLELGCATGGNIIPFAAFHPEARVLGIDIGKRQVDIGQARIAGLGLANAELRHASITELPDDLGPFNYIVCHGVYSWVPEPVREAILATCTRLLSPAGIAFISYNVLPGWRMFQPLRDALRTILPPDLDEASRARAARQFLAYAGAMTPSQNAYASLLRQAPARLSSLADSYLFHEYLEELNEPCTLADFVGAAGRHGMGYLGDCNLGSMFAENHGRDFAEQLHAGTRGDIVSLEQMLDILTGRTFRMSLLVHAGQFARIDRSITPDRLEGLHFLPSEDLSLEREGERTRILGNDGLTVDCEDPGDIALLDMLFAEPRHSFTLADLLAGEANREDRLARLFRLVTGGVAVASSLPMATRPAGDRPRANPLALGDAQCGEGYTATRRHTGVELTGLARFVLPLLDGTRTPGDLAALLANAAREGRIGIRAPDGGTPDDAELAAIAGTMVAQLIEQVSAKGLLDG